MDRKNESPYLPLLAVAVVALAAFLVYSRVFHSPFILDDRMYIVENAQLRGLSNFWPPSGTRYLGYLSFALNYHFNKLDVFGYHMVNLMIHIINSALVFALVRSIIKTPKIAASVGKGADIFIPFLSALLFAAHPVQTESVTYITQRFASLAALFYLLSFVFYIRWRNVKNGNPAFYTVSLASAILAQKTKEISFTLPVIILLFEFAFLSEKGEFKKRLPALVPFLLTLLIIPATLLIQGKGGAAGIDSKIMEAQLKELLTLSRHDYLITQFRVIVTYLRLLVLPINQNLQYDYALSKSIFEPQTLLSFLFLLAVFIGNVILFIKARARGNAYLLLAASGVFWFFITLSIESSIIPIKDVIFEHRLYLPLAGMALAFSSIVFYGAERLLSSPSAKKAALAIIVLITFIPLSAAAYTRNLDWRDKIEFYEDMASKSPRKPSVHYDLGKLYKDVGRLDDAVREYKIAIRLKPDYAEAHTNLGNVYLEKGYFDQAIEEYVVALRIDPSDPETYYNIGTAYYNQMSPQKAASAFMEAIRLMPTHIEAHNSLGNVYFRTGQFDKAQEEYLTVLKLNPDHVHGHSNLGNIYFMQKKLPEAIEEYRQALRIKPDYAGAQYNLGVVYANMGKTEDAINAYKAAIDLKPDYADAHFSLGSAYYSLKKLDDAVREFNIALRLNPDDLFAHLKIAEAFKDKGEFSDALEHYEYFVQKAPPQYGPQVNFIKSILPEIRVRAKRK